MSGVLPPVFSPFYKGEFSVVEYILSTWEALGSVPAPNTKKLRCIYRKRASILSLLEICNLSKSLLTKFYVELK
jgi:hypothetical protein